MNENITFLERKKMKRKKKYSNILLKEMKIKVCSNPTNHLVLCNAGLLTGINEENVVDFFSYYGSLTNVIMIPHKSYCFVTYQNISAAIECYTSKSHPHGKFLVQESLYVLYVEEVPSKQDLYQSYSNVPPGITIIKNFITEHEEQILHEKFDIVKEESQELSQRKVKHFGFEFNYNTNNVCKNSPLLEKIPDTFSFLKQRFIENGVNNLIPWIPDQLTINCYLPGQGIPPHVDTHSAFEDPILSLSILSDVVMDFEKCDRKFKASLLIPKRSLLIISGEARYFWTHGIISRKNDVVLSTSNGLSAQPRGKRISFTFRKIRTGECNCEYKTLCDSYNKQHSLAPSEGEASKIENEFVHKVYDNISDHFSSTRHSPWPKVREFLESLPSGSIVVDIGCGNGKYFNLNHETFHFGGDSCNKLNLICRDKAMEVIQFNCISVPIRDSTADAVICIAVIHHLSNEIRRMQALKEICRLLRVGGLALVYVWSKKQNSTKYIKKNVSEITSSSASSHKVITSDYSLNSNIVLPIHSNKTEFQHVDVLVPWNLRMKNKEESQYLRYYHLFEEDELKNMCIEIGAKIIKYYYDDGNWCVVFSKI